MSVLIIDDNQDFTATLSDLAASFGYETYAINSPEEALEYLSKNFRKISCILLDIEFGPGASMNGIDVLERCRRFYHSIPVIMISGKGTIEMAVKATKLGAVNFIEKSVLTRDKLREVLNSVLNSENMKGEAKEILKFLRSQGIISKSQAMLEIGDNIIRFGRTDLNVLVTGETGTGKKLVAQAIHMVSRRTKFPFVTVDIPNIPRELFQSELFGHNKGAFSGATDTKKGLFQQANKGAIFLDEIGDLSMELQSNLLIPIEEKIVRKVGATESEDLDVRFISATDRDLMAAIKEGKFREQLYHRLRECGINIPPLRERREDIPEIIEYYVEKHNNDFNEAKAISPSAVQFLLEQEWRGNVRELSSIVRVALQTGAGDQIEINDLTKIMTGVSSVSATAHLHSMQENDAIISTDRTLKEDLAELDKLKIESTLERTSGNVSKAAALLAISRETLHNKIRKYGINAQNFRNKKVK
jgi:DNA-binding NtrC family response regulator